MSIHRLGRVTISNVQMLHAKNWNQNSILISSKKIEDGLARQNVKSLREKSETMKIFWTKNESLNSYVNA